VACGTNNIVTKLVSSDLVYEAVTISSGGVCTIKITNTNTNEI